MALWGCAIVPKGPLHADEVRLTGLSIFELGARGEKGAFFKSIINYQGGERIQRNDIHSVCISAQSYVNT